MSAATLASSCATVGLDLRDLLADLLHLLFGRVVLLGGGVEALLVGGQLRGDLGRLRLGAGQRVGHGRPRCRDAENAAERTVTTAPATRAARRGHPVCWLDGTVEGSSTSVTMGHVLSKARLAVANGARLLEA